MLGFKGEVRLEDQHNLSEPKDRMLSKRSDVVHEQSVRLPDVSSVECFNSKDLRRALKHPLRDVIFGAPLTAKRDLKSLNAALNACLRLAVASLEASGRFGGASVALSQASLEWCRLVEMPPTTHTLSAKRAAVLFAMHVDDDFAVLFEPTNPGLVRDLKARALPLCTPAFVRSMGQNPVDYLLAVTLLCELWAGESLGMKGAYVHESAGRLADGSD